MELPRPSGIVTFLTDFGLDDPYVGVMKGMVKRQFVRADVVDLAHGVPPQDVAVGALFVTAALDRFPPGTVHVVVVDPGVGTERRLIGLHARQCYWLAPDNGVLEPLLDPNTNGELRAIDVEALAIGPRSATFHGRDVLAPLAGMLASQKLGFRAIGPRTDGAVRLTGRDADRVVHVDRYGNLLTNVPARRLAGVTDVRIRDRVVPIRSTYGNVARGDAVALVNSYGLLEIAVRDGRADVTLGAAAGDDVALSEARG